MKLTDLKGKKQLQVVGKLMEVMGGLQGDPAFDGFVEALRSADGDPSYIFKLGPILSREDVADGIVDALAFAKGCNPDEVDNPVGEIVELLTSEAELPAFLSARR